KRQRLVARRAERHEDALAAADHDRADDGLAPMARDEEPHAECAARLRGNLRQVVDAVMIGETLARHHAAIERQKNRKPALNRQLLDFEFARRLLEMRTPRSAERSKLFLFG